MPIVGVECDALAFLNAVDTDRILGIRITGEGLGKDHSTKIPGPAAPGFAATIPAYPVILHKGLQAPRFPGRHLIAASGASKDSGDLDRLGQARDDERREAKNMKARPIPWAIIRNPFGNVGMSRRIASDRTVCSAPNA